MKFILSGVDISLLEIKRMACAREFQVGETDFEFMVLDPEIIKTGQITVRLADLPEELQKTWEDFKKGVEANLRTKILGTQ